MRRAILIGNPVDKSISEITHNEIFKICGISCLYEKKTLSYEKFSWEIEELKKMNYLYLAVTMPFKESIIPFLDERKEEIGSVNTIEVVEGRWIGHNSDGIAALNAIENAISVKAKTVLVLGAGGAAKAVIYEAKKRGATVFVWNRTKDRAKRVAEEFKVFVLEDISSEFDIVIQATCSGMFQNEIPVDLKWISTKTVVLEMISNPMMTMFAKNALEKGAHVVFGYEMFMELSIAQFNIAFRDQVDKEVVKRVVKKFFSQK